MATMEDAHRVAKDSFGVTLRPVQEKVIAQLLSGGSACCILPTGGGKSLNYQLTGLLLPGLTLVVSPLIALMKDQVDVLRARGLPAAALDSNTLEEATLIKHGIKTGSLKILFVAPERLTNEKFVRSLANTTISLLAVDEAHCVSTWGHSFRPTYLTVARFAKECGAERVLCLTATATRVVAEDVCMMFDIDISAGLFTTPTYRNNLSVELVSCSSMEDKYKAILPRLKKQVGAAIVYCTTQQNVVDTCTYLRAKGITDCEFYHAGMTADERKRVQEFFMTKKVKAPVIVATIAFGMGIDKADIRTIIHFQFPKSVESYVQEIGRAGRDGEKSVCILLMDASDMPILEGFARGDTPSLTSVEHLLIAICDAPREDNGPNFYISTYEQERAFDIRSTTLGLLYAQLDLTHGFIRPLTAFYQIYEIRPVTEADVVFLVSGDSNFECRALRKSWKRGATMDAKGPRVKFTVDVLAAAESNNCSRDALSGQIARWEAAGRIVTRPTQARNRFAVLEPLPEEADDRKALARVLYDYMLSKESVEVARLRDLGDIVTKAQCISSSLGQYFGDEPKLLHGDQCGHCTFCITKTATKFGGQGIAAEIDEEKLGKILVLLPIRDDPRVLTRFAYGVTSPRLTALKLSKHALFGSLSNCDYNDLLERFDVACQAAEYKNTSATVPQPAAKRSYPAKADSKTVKKPRKA